MATSCSTLPPLTPTPATLSPSLLSGAPPPIEQNRPPDSPINGNSSCPGCTSGESSAVRNPTSAEAHKLHALAANRCQLLLIGEAGRAAMR
jgi:hypothetical protein